ncbi:MAG: DM13 domain-containing protein [Alphaproteobacteria bacterium]|nr:DM13 domain-containing protein [Alphaproteobacteria bacterium]
MKKLFLGVIVGGLLGVGAGFVAGLFFFPIIFPGPVAMEQVANAESKTAVARGTFVHADPNDPIHWGKGAVTILRDRSGEQFVRLEMDFEVGPGPAFHVYLVDQADIRSKRDFLTASTIDLGGLRAFRGSQNYAVPEGIDVASAKSVVIWCKEFGVLISPATLLQTS